MARCGTASPCMCCAPTWSRRTSSHRCATGGNPVAGDLFGSGDGFGFPALSADGATLAVGTGNEDSSHTGVFRPADGNWQAALDSDGAKDSGAAYVYRRSNDGRWAIEAFVKAPVAGGGTGAYGDDGFRGGGGFGGDVALSADGATLAAGASAEDSMAAGAFASGGEGWQAALDSDGAENSGGAYVYRRPPGGVWTLEAFVKAPVADDRVYFGGSIALSADGSALAASAGGESGGG